MSARGLGFSRPSARPGGRAALRVRGVEGWRGVACVVVVAFHVWQNMDVDGDGMGPVGAPWTLSAILSVDVVVDLFFVLSGLLLFLPFAVAAFDDDRPVPSRRELMWRRAIRVLPVYWVLVLACWSTRNFGLETAQWRDLIEHLLLVQAFDSQRIFYTIGPAWTLSVEWVFYLSLAALGPVVVHAARRRSSPTGRATWIGGWLVLLAAASLAYKVAVQRVWHIDPTAWAWRFGPVAKADDFALGMLLALLMVLLRHRRAPRLVTPLLAVVGVLAVFASRARPGADPDSLLLIWRHPLAALGWSLLLMAVMTARSERPAQWVDNAPAVRLSLLAYTIYLVHEPVILACVDLGLISTETSHYLVNLALVTVLTIGAAWLLHRLIEEPWADLGALQSRGGGRKDLYPHLRPEAALPHIPRAEPVVALHRAGPSRAEAPLREAVLAPWRTGVPSLVARVE